LGFHDIRHYLENRLALLLNITDQQLGMLEFLTYKGPNLPAMLVGLTKNRPVHRTDPDAGCIGIIKPNHIPTFEILDRQVRVNQQGFAGAYRKTGIWINLFNLLNSILNICYGHLQSLCL